ncbi:peripheral-type benzodiazepine receptor-associated protein 1-like [Lagopus leucura]|uniref:peripheral-type benzodiazepine receptor-associated protein 1-like n=1 Tax=Lagopus leucura TaxID=30410 RepID=UPI001C68144A|nr:peripheral-type benzodiazepine receptor-associated protein 1-like [Lagopus leucura]
MDVAARGLNAGKSTKAAVGRSVRQRHVAVMVLLSAVLLSALVLACIAVSQTWNKCLVCKRRERAAERAHPDTGWEGVPAGDEVESGEATREILAQANKNLSNSFSPFRSAIPEARGVQTRLEDLERELQAMKKVRGNSGRVRRFLARHSYRPSEGSNEDPESELPLTAGQHVYVFGDVDEDGWFLGELTDGTRGLVPSSLVTEVSDDELDTTMPPELCDFLLETDDCVDAKSP